MRTPTDRIEELERRADDARDGLRGISALLVNTLGVVLDEMVEREAITPDTRDTIWQRIGVEISTVAAASEPVSRAAAMAAMPHRPKPKAPLTETAPDRVPKDVLGLRPRKP